MLSLINSTVNIIGWSPLISFMAKWWYCVHYASILRMANGSTDSTMRYTRTPYSDMWCECALCVYREFKVRVWILLNNSSRLEFRVAMNRSQRYVPTLLQCAVCSHFFSLSLSLPLSLPLSSVLCLSNATAMLRWVLNNNNANTSLYMNITDEKFHGARSKNKRK